MHYLRLIKDFRLQHPEHSRFGAEAIVFPLKIASSASAGDTKRHSFQTFAGDTNQATGILWRQIFVLRSHIDCSPKDSRDLVYANRFHIFLSCPYRR